MEFRRVLFRSLYAGKIKGRNIGTEGRQRNIGEICDDAGRGLAKRHLPDTAQGNGGIFFASFGSSPETRGDRVDVGNGLKDRKSTRLNSSTNAHIVCRLLHENTNATKNTHYTYIHNQ